MFEATTSVSGLSLDRLVTLCAVAEAGSIGAATDGDTNRQSQFSRQISELEAALGVVLLDRSSRPHRLNAAGKRLAASTRLFLRDVEAFRAQAESTNLRVVVGAGESLIQGVLLPASEAVRKKLGGVRFAFRNLASEEVLSQLTHGELDVGILRSEEAGPALATSQAWTYGYDAWVPAGLSSRKGNLKTAELESLPWAVLEGRGHFRRFLQTRASAAGVKLNIGVECSSYAQAAGAVLTGKYAGFLPTFQKLDAGELAVLRRKPEEVLSYRRSLVLAWLPRAVASRPGLSDVVEGLRRAMDRVQGLQESA